MKGRTGNLIDFLFTPIPVAVTIIHWLIFGFAFFGSDRAADANVPSDIVPMMVAATIAWPFIAELQGWLAEGLARLLYFALISLQWLLIGKLIESVVRPRFCNLRRN
ncbi:MAG TPA: hypothetical protein PKO33_05720 [Pyrinomonadaceae bacterium]|nr:hypothetical protein [Pyrinomonadaceae bacterium]